MNKRCCRDTRENKKPLYFYKVKVISEAETIKCCPEFSVSKQYVYFQASIFYLGNTLPCQSTVAVFERKRKQINYLLFVVVVVVVQSIGSILIGSLDALPCGRA